MTRDRLEDLTFDNLLVQPRIRFRYEVSFYFVDRTFQYALYAPHPISGGLERYDPSTADLDFAQRFVDWNTVERGIQRVDACRTPKGNSCWSSWRTSIRTSRSTGDEAGAGGVRGPVEPSVRELIR